MPAFELPVRHIDPDTRTSDLIARERTNRLADAIAHNQPHTDHDELMEQARFWWGVGWDDEHAPSYEEMHIWSDPELRRYIATLKTAYRRIAQCQKEHR